MKGLDGRTLYAKQGGHEKQKRPPLLNNKIEQSPVS